MQRIRFEQLTVLYINVKYLERILIEASPLVDELTL